MEENSERTLLFLNGRGGYEPDSCWSAYLWIVDDHIFQPPSSCFVQSHSITILLRQIRTRETKYWDFSITTVNSMKILMISTNKSCSLTSSLPIPGLITINLVIFHVVSANKLSFLHSSGSVIYQELLRDFFHFWITWTITSCLRTCDWWNHAQWKERSTIEICSALCRDTWLNIIEFCDTREWLQLSYTCKGINLFKFNQLFISNKRTLIRTSGDGLDMSGCMNITEGIHTLDMSGCTQITDGAFPHLTGIHPLYGWLLADLNSAPIIMLSFCW